MFTQKLNTRYGIKNRDITRSSRYTKIKPYNMGSHV